MKKILALALAAVMVLSLAGCGGGGGQSSSQAPANTQAPGTTQAPGGSSEAPASTEAPGNEFAGQSFTMTFTTGDNYAQDAIMNQLDKFQKKYGCTIDLTMAANDSDGAYIRTAIATDSLTDVFNYNVGSWLTALDPETNCYAIEGEPWIDQISEGYRAIQSSQYNGHVFMAPADTSNAAGVLYNKKVFEELGLDIPMTWDDFLATCQKIKDAGKIPVAAPYVKASNTQIPYLMGYFYVQQENPNFAEDYTTRKIELHESEAFVYSLQKLYDMYPYLNEDFLATGMEECAQMLGDGDAAMMVIRTNIISTMEGVCPDKINDIDFFPLPDKDPNKRGISCWMPAGYAINKNAKNLPLALKLFEFLTSQEGIDAYTEITTPKGTFALNNIDLSGLELAPAIITAQNWVTEASSPCLEYFCPIKGANMMNITQALCAQDITVDDACKQIEDDNAIDAQQKGIPGWE